jgi:hypothetical protein
VSTVGVHFARCTFCLCPHARGRTLREATAAIPAAPPRIPSSARGRVLPRGRVLCSQQRLAPPRITPGRASLPQRPAPPAHQSRPPSPLPEAAKVSIPPLAQGFHPAAASSAFHRSRVSIPPSPHPAHSIPRPQGFPSRNHRSRIPSRNHRYRIHGFNRLPPRSPSIHGEVAGYF